MSFANPLILTVDDNPRNLQILGKLLSENGYDIGVAMDGGQALNFVNNNDPDLILLDIMMPGIDGYDVCRTIKADIKTKHIPIIFITAKTETDDIVKGFDAGGVDYVTKPFNTRELLARVKTHVEMKLLKGLIPICSNCKMIRNDEGFWNGIESFLEIHADIMFTHSICPDCLQTLYGDKKWFKKKFGR